MGRAPRLRAGHRRDRVAVPAAAGGTSVREALGVCAAALCDYVTRACAVEDAARHRLRAAPVAAARGAGGRPPRARARAEGDRGRRPRRRRHHRRGGEGRRHAGERRRRRRARGAAQGRLRGDAGTMASARSASPGVSVSDPPCIAVGGGQEASGDRAAAMAGASKRGQIRAVSARRWRAQRSRWGVAERGVRHKAAHREHARRARGPPSPARRLARLPFLRGRNPQRKGAIGSAKGAPTELASPSERASSARQRGGSSSRKAAPFLCGSLPRRKGKRASLRAGDGGIAARRTRFGWAVLWRTPRACALPVYA
jgi:hypothetical protein